jgi:choline kinase
MILIILASGSGKRLKNKTKKIPKCLVKVNGKPIIEYMQKFINCFDKIFVITGYRSDKIKKFFNNKKVKVIYNKKYNSTNMVHSLFCASKYIKEDVIVSYSDIIFDYSIFHSLKRKKFNSIPVKTNWLKLWKKRMPISKIKKDAESLSSNGNKLISIGEKITKKFPKYQFMGLIKIIYKDFILMKKYYDKINNKKIDFTSFINLMLKDKKIKIHCLKTNKFWLEIDNLIDLNLAEQLLKSK